MSGLGEASVWEIRHRRTWRLVGSFASFAEAEAEYNRLLRRTARQLNRPGLHGGLRVDEFADLVLIEVES